MRNVLITGAGSLIGAELLSCLARHPTVERLSLLLCGNDEAQAQTMGRLRELIGNDTVPFEVIRGHLLDPYFGLSRSSWRAWAQTLDTVFHLAEQMNGLSSAQQAQRINTEPVEVCLQLLEHNPNLRLHQLSTVFAGGERVELLAERALYGESGFYAQSKREAEKRLRASAHSGQVTIYRTSHRVGHSQTGAAFVNGGLYPFLHRLSTEESQWQESAVCIDIVPANYLAIAMTMFASNPRTSGHTFSLVCGERQAIAMSDLARMVRQEAAESVANSQGLNRSSGSFYNGKPPSEDDKRGRKTLDSYAFRCPNPRDYLPQIARWADSHGWHGLISRTTALEVSVGAGPNSFHEPSGTLSPEQTGGCPWRDSSLAQVS